MMRLLLVAFLLGGAGGLVPVFAGAADMRPAADAAPFAAPTLAFDIPAQPLQSAIERYSVITGISVAYLGTLVIGRTSVPVKGYYAPDQALDLLLGDARLAVKHTTPQAYVLTQTEQETGEGLEMRNGVPSATAAASYRRYYGAVQASLREMLCQDAKIAPDNFRAALQLWVDTAGRVTQVHLLDTTGDHARDAAIVEALRRTSVGQPPPAELEQPFTLLILPRAAAKTVDCHVG